MKEFDKRLAELIRFGRIRVDEPMSAHTTFRIGGPADYYVEPETREELAGLLKLCRESGQEFMILGNGSNLLVGDGGYRGVMIAPGKAFSGITVEGDRIRAGAGAMLAAVAKQALSGCLTGLEFAAGIPGTVGGAVFMNAGAYGSDMSAVLETVTVMNRDGAVLELPASSLELGYRTSCISREGYVVLEAVMRLQPGEEASIRTRMEELALQRRTKQPLEYPSAGSTFKRPAGYFAGKLIEDAGLRGYRTGGAQVSEKHCGFVINRGGATAADVMELCRTVQQKVKEQSGVDLEMEVRVLGLHRRTDG